MAYFCIKSEDLEMDSYFEQIQMKKADPLLLIP